MLKRILCYFFLWNSYACGEESQERKEVENEDLILNKEEGQKEKYKNGLETESLFKFMENDDHFFSYRNHSWSLGGSSYRGTGFDVGIDLGFYMALGYEEVSASNGFLQFKKSDDKGKYHMKLYGISQGISLYSRLLFHFDMGMRYDFGFVSDQKNESHIHYLSYGFGVGVNLFRHLSLRGYLSYRWAFGDDIPGAGKNTFDSWNFGFAIYFFSRARTPFFPYGTHQLRNSWEN